MNEHHEFRPAQRPDKRSGRPEGRFEARTDGKPARPRRGVAAPKFRSPDGLNQWSGRGRQPGWMTELLNEGYTEDDLLIKDE